MTSIQKGELLLVLLAVGFSGFLIFSKPSVSRDAPVAQPAAIASALAAPVEEPVPDMPLETFEPEPLRAIYLSSWTAGSKLAMERIFRLLDATTANAVVIDIKDATGRISYMPLDPELLAVQSGTRRIADLPGLLQRLHDRDIYVIGRVSVFQDPFYAQRYPSEAFMDLNGALWKDRKGLAWLHPASVAVREYTVSIGKDAHAQGFDEINLDYVRFPSDGNLSTLNYCISKSREAVMEDFFIAVGAAFRDAGIPLSVDVFGLTMSAQGDLGIGQKLERIAPHVDYVYPMVYPSHFASGSYGVADPARNPYAIISASLAAGLRRMAAMGLEPERMRPWLQDFNLGAIYTADMVADQIRAAEELGLSSWLLWDPANRYTPEAFMKAE